LSEDNDRKYDKELWTMKYAEEIWSVHIVLKYIRYGQFILWHELWTMKYAEEICTYTTKLGNVVAMFK
jgi:hypothetical protein